MTVGNQGTRYLLFIRNDNNGEMEKGRVKYYKEKILLPFVDQLRKTFNDLNEGDKISDEMQV